MNRQTIYANELFLDTDFGNQVINEYIASSKILEAVFGTDQQFSGLACVPTGPASLNVVINPGQIFKLAAIDTTAYGSIPADPREIVKQAIMLDALTIPLTAPVTASYEIKYLIQGTLEEDNATAAARAFFNDAEPTGLPPVITNVSSLRSDVCVINAKAGTPAPIGTGAIPSLDSGFIGLWVVTVITGQTQIIAGDIVAYTNQPIITRFEPTAVTPGTYTNATVTVNAFGQITAASDSVLGFTNFLSKKQICSNNGSDAANDIDFAACKVRNVADTGFIILPTLMVKKLDVVWSAGTNAGGRASGAALANGTWHCFLISKSDGTTDCGFDTSLTATNLLTDAVGYINYRRVWSIMRVAGSIRAYTNVGDLCLWKSPTVDVDETPPSTAAISVPVATPLGLFLPAKLFIQVRCLDTDVSFYISSLLVNDLSAGLLSDSKISNAGDSAGPGITQIDGTSEIQVITNTSSEIRIRADSTAGTEQILIATQGYIDDRAVA